MSYSFSSGAFASVAACPVPASTSFSMFAWFNAPNALTNGYIAQLASAPLTLIDTYYFRATGNDIFAIASDGTGLDANTTENYIANGVWCCGAAMYTVGASNTCTESRAWGYNSATGNATAVALSSGSKVIDNPVSNTIIGIADTNSQNFFTGLIAHFAIWSKVLSGEELNALKFVSPNQVAAANLIGYWPLTTNLVDTVSGLTLAPTGSVELSELNPTIDLGNTSVARLAAYLLRR